MRIVLLFTLGLLACDNSPCPEVATLNVIDGTCSDEGKQCTYPNSADTCTCEKGVWQCRVVETPRSPSP
jgi:hypothetical protein